MTKKLDTAVANTFGHSIRIRVMGILKIDHKLLLIKHKGIGEHNEYWLPPGGGVHKNETMVAALVREFKEECGLAIEVKKLLRVNEYLNKPLHAIEYFFEVAIKGGNLVLGFDPELKNQVMVELKTFDLDQLRQLKKGTYPILLNDFFRKIND